METNLNIMRRTASSQLSFTERDDPLLLTIKKLVSSYVSNHKIDEKKEKLCLLFLETVMDIIKFGNTRFENEAEFQTFIAIALTVPCGNDPKDLLEEHKIINLVSEQKRAEFISIIYKSPLCEKLQAMRLGDIFMNMSSSPIAFFGNRINSSQGTYRKGSKTAGTIVTTLAISIFNELKTEYLPIGNLLFHKRGAEINTGERILDLITFQELYDVNAFLALPYRDRYECAYELEKRVQLYNQKEVNMSLTSIINALKKLHNADRNIRHLVGGTEVLKESIKYLLNHHDIIKAKLENSDPEFVPGLDNKKAMPALIALILSLPHTEKSVFFEKLICSTQLDEKSATKMDLILDGIGLTEPKYLAKLIQFLPESAGTMLAYSCLTIYKENSYNTEMVMKLILSTLALHPERLNEYMLHLQKYKVDINKLIMSFHDYLFKRHYSRLEEPIKKLRMECFTTFFFSPINKNGIFILHGTLVPTALIKYIYSHKLEKDENIQREFFKRLKQSTYAAKSMIYDSSLAGMFYAPVFGSKLLKVIKQEELEAEIKKVPENYEWIEDKYTESEHSEENMLKESEENRQYNYRYLDL
jgi:hypothetical protein